ncbi:MAG: decaprenyl-phosphate phosphoribosyltransferase [Proteobacteria bacterium]|nr:decaprenyl-phosphate phosphoribosyltransferase [Pseudomonadota bacterium]
MDGCPLKESSHMRTTTAFLVFRSMRPRQWTKNLILFAALIFSQNVFSPPLLFKAIAAFAIFCLLSGCVYIINDLLDLQQDKIHPVKSKRPLASGKLKPATAVIAAIALFCLSFGGAAALTNRTFIIIAVIYFVLQIAYSTLLKHVVILDVFCIAMLLSLFLALSKRRHELMLLEDDAVHHRKILFEYSPYLLDQMISVVTASTVITYTLYTVSEDTVSKFGTDRLKYTIPFVLYGIFRYLYLIHQKNEGGSPERVLLNDLPLIICVLLYGLTVGLILYL